MKPALFAHLAKSGVYTKLTGMTTIRPAAPADLDQLMALEALFPSDRLTRTRLRYHLSNPRALFLIAAEGGRVTGYALFFRRLGRAARFYSLIVDPAWRGQGIAQQLVEAGCARLRREGEKKMRLEVDAGDKKAIAFHARCGFIAGHVIPSYYEDGRDALTMTKDLMQ